MTGSCIFCHATNGLIRRRIGRGGIEVDVCERCSDLGRQARAVADTLRPFAPYLERAVAKGLPAIVKGLAKAIAR